MSRSEKIIGCYMKAVELFCSIEHWEQHDIHILKKDDTVYQREHFYIAYSAMLGELYIVMREIIKYLRSKDFSTADTLKKAMDEVKRTTDKQIAHKEKGTLRDATVSLLLAEYIVVESYHFVNNNMNGTEHENILGEYFKYLPFSQRNLENKVKKELKLLTNNS